MVVFNDYAMASGYITQTALNADSDALLKNWKSRLVAGDSDAIALDFNVQSFNEIDYGTIRVNGLDNRARQFGTITVSPWTLILSSDMAIFLESEIFSGAIDALVTIKTYDQYTKTSGIFNCIVERPMFIGNSTQNVNNVYLPRFQMIFKNVVIASVS